MFTRTLSSAGLALGVFASSNAMAVEYGAVVSRTAVFREIDVATRQCDSQGTDCKTVKHPETKLIGFDIVYDYNGHRYNARVPNDPGDRIALDVSVTPSISQNGAVGASRSPPAADIPAEVAAAPLAGESSGAPVPAYPEPDPSNVYVPSPVTTYAYPGAYPGVIVAAPPVIVVPGIGFGYRGGYHRPPWR